MAATAPGTEGARDALQRAAEYLETRSVPAFEAEFGALFDCREDFDPATDAIDLAVVPDATVGIGDWEFGHFRLAGDDGDAQCLRHRSFEGGVQPRGVSAIHPVGYQLEPRRVMQGLFEVLVYHLTEQHPGAALSNATLKVAMYREDLTQPPITDDPIE
ncbi:MAG: hypothetical protein V5A18_07865 [Haloarculaceae archaeon]